MPQFTKVAEKGDTILMGLEGDPLFPFKNKERLTGTITGIKHRENDSLVRINLSNGKTREYNSMSLAADEVWEFDDKTFKNVLERQQKSENNVNVKEYRGTASNQIEYKETIETMSKEISQLKSKLSHEEKQSKQFHNTVVASLNEMAKEICNLDTSGKNTEFCRTLKSEYDTMNNTANEKKSSENYRGIVEQSDMSETDTDFF
jgi:hypothetical protein